MCEREIERERHCIVFKKVLKTSGQRRFSVVIIMCGDHTDPVVMQQQFNYQAIAV